MEVEDSSQIDAFFLEMTGGGHDPIGHE